MEQKKKENRLIIVGAGGHGRVIADSALKNGYTDICFVDDHTEGEVLGFPIIGTSKDLENLNDGRTDFVIGIGNNAIRKALAVSYPVNWVSLIHPSAQIAFHTVIGKGTVIMANAVVNACSTIGEHCIINTGAVVEHDNVIGDYVHVSASAVLGGTVKVGAFTVVGIGAVVKNNIEISSGCMVDPGTIVTMNLSASAE
jgi:sugar O-acyltransferase (sialic acid O-acetyltransferase NeuD family)